MAQETVPLTNGGGPGHGWPLGTQLSSRRAQAHPWPVHSKCSLLIPFTKGRGRYRYPRVGDRHWLRSLSCSTFESREAGALLSCLVSLPWLPKLGTHKCFLPAPTSSQLGGLWASLCALGPAAPLVGKRAEVAPDGEKERPSTLGWSWDSLCSSHRVLCLPPELRPTQALPVVQWGASH